jgi:hypothetical protein
VIYFDEQFSHRLLDACRGEGIDATTVNLLGHKGESDAL